MPEYDGAMHPRRRERFRPRVHDPFLPRAHVLRRESQPPRPALARGLQHPIFSHRSPEPDEVVPAHDHLEVRVRPLFLQAGDVGVPAGVGVDDEAVERAVAVVGVRLRHHVRTRRADLVVVAGE